MAHEKSAIETIKWRNAQNSAPETGAPSPPKGQAAIRADIQKAQGSLPERAQARDQAAAPDDAALKGKAGLQADRYKAMQSEPQKPTPARDGGRDR